MNYTDIQISSEEAAQILEVIYGLKARVKELPGEIDFNFYCVTAEDEKLVLKVSRPEEQEQFLDFQKCITEHLADNAALNTSRIVRSLDGSLLPIYMDRQGIQRKVRVLSWIPGRLWSAVKPHNNKLRKSLGQQAGQLTAALMGFEHAYASRKLDWDIAQGLWVKDFLHLFSDEEKEILNVFIQQFEAVIEPYNILRKSVVHNDVNDNNIIVTEDLLAPEVRAIIDYGDAVLTQSINDLAITCAYAAMGHEDPLDAVLPVVKGYHQFFQLEEKELEHLYTCIAMRLVISVCKSAINKDKEPENTYLLISEKPAWSLLKKWVDISQDFAYYAFRFACGYTAHPDEASFKDWVSNQKPDLLGLFPTIGRSKVQLLDLSVSSTWVGHRNDFNDLDLFQFKLDQLQKEYPDCILAGGYMEPRALYTATSYDKIGNYGRQSRAVHLGVDFWLAAGTPVHALYGGEVVVAANDTGDKNYGGLVILKHEEDGCLFYSLYGHNELDSVLQHKVGDYIEKGAEICRLGDRNENGNWAPHLHFQLMLNLLDFKDDFPGVAYPNEKEIWRSFCPDPNLLFKLPNLTEPVFEADSDILEFRKKHLGKGMSLQYNVPIKMVRGDGAWLIDQGGRKYLDTVNNVAHVGHEHPAVVKAGQQQMSILNTNTRYLHENINKLAAALVETLPPELNVIHFVNSGSEANELAIRMVKTVTGQKDIIASQVGYHGNTNICVDISSYKFDGKGGAGAPEFTHIFPLPDTFRGKYTGADAAERYAEEVDGCIHEILELGRKPGGFIIESIISCGGQIELPEGFLKAAYEKVRAHGALCISDEVQVGCGRSGAYFWGFQLHDVVPDIVTIGKPLGNGHPIAAVACTQEVAEKFANGMEYFNTFGGNPVSCAIGLEVLNTVKREGLQEQALELGNYLKTELRVLSQKFSIIGDVRGQGLFLGIELVDKHKNPLAAQTSYLANRMKDHGILMSTDGPDHNVLKIKPPMVFSKSNADDLLYYLSLILEEDFMKV